MKTFLYVSTIVVVILRATRLISVFDDYKEFANNLYNIEIILLLWTSYANYQACFILTYEFDFTLNLTLFFRVIVIIDACISIENRNQSRYAFLAKQKHCLRLDFIGDGRDCWNCYWLRTVLRACHSVFATKQQMEIFQQLAYFNHKEHLYSYQAKFSFSYLI